MDLLDRIDAATEGRCACGCGRLLPADGPSAYWAGPDCQRRWNEARADRPDEVYERPDAAEYPPGPMRWHPGAAVTDADVEHIRRTIATAARAFEEFRSQFAPAFVEFARNLNTIVGQVQAASRTQAARPRVPAPAPTDLMKRALWLRRNRNTGPTPAPLDPRRRRRWETPTSTARTGA
jgi:hypothetical protein